MSDPFLSTDKAEKTVGRRFYPIIFLRGYAMRQSDIEAAVEEPFSGFERGSTKYKQSPDGLAAPYYFESAILRLITDWGYEDAYHNGLDLSKVDDLRNRSRPERTLWAYRYYEEASEFFGDGKRDEIEAIAYGLDRKIDQIRGLYRELGEKTGKDYDSHFKVHLVAHSMGGLIVRSYIQKVFPSQIKSGNRVGAIPVDKVFTYGTPHNGIEIRGLGNRIGLGLFDISNFARDKMREYLYSKEEAKKKKPVNDLGDAFDPNRFFCLIGTNYKDYNVPISTRAVGPMSDGLVRIANAWVKNAPRAHIHRAHGGPYGLVNSEDGYQNLQRFLFGNYRVDGFLSVTDMKLPKHIVQEREAGKEITGNFYFDNVVSVRNTFGWNLSRRKAEEGSSVWREYNHLFPGTTGFKDQEFMLFSSFLDSKHIAGSNKYLAFAVDLHFLVDRFVVDRKAWFDQSFDGITYYNQQLIIEIRQDETADHGWRFRYRLPSKQADGDFEYPEPTPIGSGIEYRIPISGEGRPGITADLVLRASPWA